VITKRDLADHDAQLTNAQAVDAYLCEHYYEHDLAYEADIRASLAEVQRAHASASGEHKAYLATEIALYERMLGGTAVQPEEAPANDLLVPPQSAGSRFLGGCARCCSA
jgi:hypothetical protein